MQRQGRRKGGRKKDDSGSSSSLPQLRRMDWLILGLFVFSLILWGVTQCGGDEESSAEGDTAVADSTLTGAAPVAATPSSPTNASNVPETVYMERSLYVIIDSLSMRTGPYLDSTRVDYLREGQELYDMGEITEFAQSIRISADEIRTEPWVKVKTKKGKVGWVFGAGLHFYKRPNTRQDNE